MPPLMVALATEDTCGRVLGEIVAETIQVWPFLSSLYSCHEPYCTVVVSWLDLKGIGFLKFAVVLFY